MASPMAIARNSKSRLVGRLSVDAEAGAFLGDLRIRLLEAIAAHGSITKAARSLPLSYKAAWDAVDAMNNIADSVVVTRTTGGHHGGGAQLTEFGMRLVAMYRALEQEYGSAVDALFGHVNDPGAGDVREFRSMLRRMSLRSSARNQFAGPVCALGDGPAGIEVRIRLDEGSELSSIVTRTSVESLGLRIGTQVMALCKAASVKIHAAPPSRARGMNALAGKVARIAKGDTHAEVNLGLAGGRTITALASFERLRELELKVGSACCATVDPASVILVC